jgi:FkbM family methyltransferase
MNINYYFTQLKRSLIRCIRTTLHAVNISVVKHSDLESMKHNIESIILERSKIKSRVFDDKFLESLDPGGKWKLSNYIPRSYSSELHQDLFVLSTLKFKEHGFFVEFGATNGIDGSNTYMLEKFFHWRGILAEPAKSWHIQLQKNRPLAMLEYNCVWRDSNSKILFSEIPDAPGLSTISEFKNSDLHNNSRKHGYTYKVKTISLNDMLEKYNAPKVIDYISIDTEGSEYEILMNFNFNKYKSRIITVEHNYNGNRNSINSLLQNQGYRRVFTDISLYDDWYVNVSLENK